MTVFFTFVTDDRNAMAERIAGGFGMPASDVLESPHALIGTRRPDRRRSAAPARGVRLLVHRLLGRRVRCDGAGREAAGRQRRRRTMNAILDLERTCYREGRDDAPSLDRAQRAAGARAGPHAGRRERRGRWSARPRRGRQQGRSADALDRALVRPARRLGRRDHRWAASRRTPVERERQRRAGSARFADQPRDVRIDGCRLAHDAGRVRRAVRRGRGPRSVHGLLDGLRAGHPHCGEGAAHAARRARDRRHLAGRAQLPERGG